MPGVIVFDVNETLLDLRVLAPHFQRIFGDATVMQQWFARVLHSSLVAPVAGVYFDFGTIGDAALEVTAARQGVVLSTDDHAKVLDGMQTLPPPDVRDSLERLHNAGLRLATLTNSTVLAHFHARGNHIRDKMPPPKKLAQALLDEFESLADNLHLGPRFFSGLRALSSQSDLSFVTTSRQPLLRLTYANAETLISPFFNAFANLHLSL